jgi:lipopolysaccharide assembly LptE-like protein
MSKTKARDVFPTSRRWSELIGLLVLAALATGCGYHFAAEGSGLPAQAKTIYVQKFTNRTRYTGFNDQLMRYIKDEIADHKRLELVDTPSEADLVLNGELVYIQSLSSASNAVGEPIIYSQTISANAVLTDAHTHKIVWTTSGVTGSQSAPAVASAVVTTSPWFLQQNLRSQDIAQLPDIQLAQTQRNFSRDQMMEQLAQNLYVSMSEGF